MFLVRDVQRRDLPELKKLASELNTVNLPDNQEMLASLIDKSVKSFTGSIEDALARQYLFVAEDVANKALVGTSMIIAQHATYTSPHTYYELTHRHHHPPPLTRHF